MKNLVLIQIPCHAFFSPSLQHYDYIKRCPCLLSHLILELMIKHIIIPFWLQCHNSIDIYIYINMLPLSDSVVASVLPPITFHFVIIKPCFYDQMMYKNGSKDQIVNVIMVMKSNWMCMWEKMSTWVLQNIIHYLFCMIIDLKWRRKYLYCEDKDLK